MTKGTDDRLSRLMHGGGKPAKAPKDPEAPVAKKAAGVRVGLGKRAGAPVPTPAPRAATKVASASQEVPEQATPAPAAGRFGTARSTAVGKAGLSLGAKALPLAKIDAWSYSRLSDWELCPLKAKFKHVERRKEPGSEAMERGSRIHKLAEDFTKGDIKALPKELAHFDEEFGLLKGLKPACEEQWAFDSSWSSVGWFDRPWLRVKTDVSVMDRKQETGRIIDHKTGKVKNEHEDQLSLYAVSFFARVPSLETVASELWYLDEGVKKELEFTRSQFQELQEYWNDRVRPMMEDTRFPARPNRLCSWCHFRASNGGPCKF